MKIVLALGGNAIAQKGKASYKEQLAAVRKTSKSISSLVKSGHKLVITHGNGPQVGNIMLQQEAGKRVSPIMPLFVAGAESQGEVGYLIQQQLQNEFRRKRMKKEVVTLLTQVLVSKTDLAFKNPTKFIGPFYTSKQAVSLRRKYKIKKQDARGWRRVVASPKPIDILEKSTINSLLAKGCVVIACGGGGIPVTKSHSGFEGVEAVIDKDRSAALLGKLVRADLLVILTDVDGAYLNYGKKNQKLLSKLKLNEALRLLKQGEWPEGSFAPKIESACNFIKSGGKKAVIAHLGKAGEALAGKSGTVITQ